MRRIPGFACFGLITWDKTSRLGASVLDLKYSGRTGNLNASSSATAWLAIIGIFPIGVPVETVGRVCSDLGRRLTRYLDGEPVGR